MNNLVTVLRGSTLLLLSILFLNSCSPVDKKQPVSHTVEIKEMKFQPAELWLNSGDTVIFVNNDMVAHDITEVNTQAWTSSSLPPGEKWSMVVNKSSDYFCSIHTVMKGKLLVRTN
jgi:plastocyanin